MLKHKASAPFGYLRTLIAMFCLSIYLYLLLILFFISWVIFITKISWLVYSDFSFSKACIHSITFLKRSGLRWCSNPLHHWSSFKCWYIWTFNGWCKLISFFLHIHFLANCCIILCQICFPVIKTKLNSCLYRSYLLTLITIASLHLRRYLLYQNQSWAYCMMI